MSIFKKVVKKVVKPAAKAVEKGIRKGTGAVLDVKVRKAGDPSVYNVTDSGKRQRSVSIFGKTVAKGPVYRTERTIAQDVAKRAPQPRLPSRPSRPSRSAPRHGRKTGLQ